MNAMDGIDEAVVGLVVQVGSAVVVVGGVGEVVIEDWVDESEVKGVEVDY